MSELMQHSVVANLYVEKNVKCFGSFRNSIHTNKKQNSRPMSLEGVTVF